MGTFSLVQMSDRPKPRPGSLRDRIAAFESTAPTAPQTAPATSQPRTRPGTVAWKPRPPSPQEPQNAASADDRGKPSSGLSVSDARDSISKAGSLRDRMAALQGKGAFGAPSPPPIAPKPAPDRPKWRPPPQVVSPPDDDPHSTLRETAPLPASPTALLASFVPRASPPSDAAATTPADHVTPSQEEGGGADEDEERQRRAAIAARMARLGGARVGMAPPIFGRKPSVPKPDTPVDVPVTSPKHEEAPNGT